MDEKKARNQDLYRMVSVLKEMMDEGYQPDMGSEMLGNLLSSRDRYDLDARIFKGIRDYGKEQYVDALQGFFNRMAEDEDVLDYATGEKFLPIGEDETFVLPERPVPTSPKEMTEEEIDEQLLPFILQYNGFGKDNFRDFFEDRSMMREPSALRTFFGVHSLGADDGDGYEDGAGIGKLMTGSKDPVLHGKLTERYVPTDGDDEEAVFAKRKNMQKLRRDMGWYGSDEELLDRINDLAIRGQFYHYDNNGKIDSPAEFAQMVAQYIAPNSMEAWRNGDGPEGHDVIIDTLMGVPNLLSGIGGLLGKGGTAVIRSPLAQSLATGLGKIKLPKPNSAINVFKDAVDVAKNTAKASSEHPVFKFGGDFIRDVATESLPYAVANTVNDIYDGGKERTYTTEDNPFVSDEFNEGVGFAKSLNDIKDGSKIGGILSALPISLIRGGKAFKRKGTQKAIDDMNKRWTKKKKDLQEQLELDDEKFERFIKAWKTAFGKTYDNRRTPSSQDKDVQTGRDALDLVGKKYGN